MDAQAVYKKLYEHYATGVTVSIQSQALEEELIGMRLDQTHKKVISRGVRMSFFLYAVYLTPYYLILILRAGVVLRYQRGNVCRSLM